MPVVTLGGAEITLSPPESYAACYEVSAAGLTNYRRGACAALGLCWQGEGAPKTQLRQQQYDVHAYGAAVLDELVARGLDGREVLAAAVVAWGLVHAAVTPAKAVDEAEGNSEALEPSTS